MNLHSERCCGERLTSWCWRLGCMFRGRNMRCSLSGRWSSHPSRWWRSRCKASRGSIHSTPVRSWRFSPDDLLFAAEMCRSRWRVFDHCASRSAADVSCTFHKPLEWCAISRETPPSSSPAMRYQSSPTLHRLARFPLSRSAWLWWSSDWTPNGQFPIAKTSVSCRNRDYL